MSAGTWEENVTNSIEYLEKAVATLREDNKFLTEMIKNLLSGLEKTTESISLLRQQDSTLRDLYVDLNKIVEGLKK